MALRTIGLTTAVLLLAACGSDEKTYTVKDADTGETTTATVSEDGDQSRIVVQGEDGKTATVITGGGGEAPKDLPPYAPLYPGAKITHTMAGMSADGTGGMVGLETGDSADKVAAFYKEKFAASGLKETMDANMNGTRMLSIGEPGGKGGAAVVITPGDGGTTQVQITYGQNKG
ncbi:hypothetical protein [Parapedomonas caeni]